MRRALRNKGFSLMEVLVALSVLAVASVGALSGLVFASKQFRLGQSTTQGTVLAERTMQRLRLASRSCDAGVDLAPFQRQVLRRLHFLQP